MKIILASNSPRRKELLLEHQIAFDVFPSTVKENLLGTLSPEENVKRLAKRKCLDVFAKFPDDLVIGADTIVVYNGKIFGKPRDKKDAYDMLKALQGKKHQVMTGVCVASPNGISNEVVISNVEFYSVIDEEIWDYIETGEPMDKAGAYAIQGIGSKFVRHYDGAFDNIVGLPMDKLLELLNLHK